MESKWQNQNLNLGSWFWSCTINHRLTLSLTSNSFQLCLSCLCCCHLDFLLLHYIFLHMALCTWLLWSQVKWSPNLKRRSDLEQRGYNGHVPSQSTLQRRPANTLTLELQGGRVWCGRRGWGSSHTGWVADGAKTTRHHYGVLRC